MSQVFEDLSFGCSEGWVLINYSRHDNNFRVRKDLALSISPHHTMASRQASTEPSWEANVATALSLCADFI